MKSQEGFTLTEIAVVLFGVAFWALTVGGLIWVVIHFIRKFW